MTAIASSTNLSLQEVQDNQQQAQLPSEELNKSSPTNKNTTSKTKKPRTKVKYNPNGSSTTSFKLDKEVVNTTTTSTTATTKKKKSPKSKITFVDESEAGNESDQQKQQECNASMAKPITSNFGAPRTVNKRLCKLRKQLKSCDHFTDNYFVIDLNNKGGQKTSTPQVVSFKSPTEHFILHEEDEDATHSDDDSSINSTDASSDEKSNKRKRKENKSSSKKQKQDQSTQPDTYTPPELKPADNIMTTQLLNSLVDTMNTLSAELRKQDSSVVAHLLQQLLQQNGSELFKQMQQQIIAQFQTEFQNLMSQAITQQMTHNNQMFATPFIPNTNDPMLATNNITTPQECLSPGQEFYDLMNEVTTNQTTSNNVNSQYLSRWNHIDVRPTSPLTLSDHTKTEAQENDRQSFLLEQGDCSFDSLFSPDL